MDDSGSALIQCKMSSGKGGDELGTLTEQKQTTMDATQTAGFLDLLEDENFWRMNSREDEMTGFDGAQWVIEGVHDGKYKLVDRWSPKADTPAGKIGRELIKLADWKIDELD